MSSMEASRGTSQNLWPFSHQGKRVPEMSPEPQTVGPLWGWPHGASSCPCSSCSDPARVALKSDLRVLLEEGYRLSCMAN